MFDIRLFGAIEIESNGEILTDFRSQKTLALLAYLISENRAVTRDYLAGLAWPDSDQKQALGLLRRSLHSLTRQLPGCFETNRRTVRWREDAPASVDVYRFEQLASSASADDWAAGVRLYRAPFLEGIYLDGSPEFERWLGGEQQSLHQHAARMLMQLIGHHSRQAEYERALAYAQRLLALEPWHEEAHRKAMLLLARSGRIDLALAQYEKCTAILDEELGMEPAIETERVRAQLVALTRSRTPTLPAPATAFVGRRTEVDALSKLLLDPANRLVSLLGPGGIGKTRLAIQVAAHLSAGTMRYFLHGVGYLSLGSVDSSNALVVGVADALGLPLEQGEDPLVQVLGFLGNKELLLILDEFEHLLDTDALDVVTQLLRGSQSLTLLVTSRAALHIPGETRHPLGGLTTPDSAQIVHGFDDDASQVGDAVQLFVETARRIRPGFAATAQELTAIAQLCRHVQGMPLAVELAAAWSAVLTPMEIAAEIKAGLDFLGGDSGNRPARHASIRAVLDSSWRRLAEAEQNALQRLAVSRGGFTRQAAAGFGAATAQILLALTDKSFLQRNATGRYDMHPLLHQYAAEALGRSPGRLETAQEEHCTYFTVKLAQWAIDARGARQEQAWKAICHEVDNIAAAWAWAAMHQRIDLLMPCVDGLGLLYARLGAFTLGEAACQTIVRMPCLADTPHEERTVEQWIVLIKALSWQARFSDDLGRSQQALEPFRLAQTLSDNAFGWMSSHVEARRAVGFFHLTGGQLFRHTDRSQAREHYRRSEDIFTELDDLWGLSQAKLGQSRLARESGDYTQAERLGRRSLAMAERMENARGIADAGSILGLIHMDLGDFQTARTFMEQALQIARTLDVPREIATALEILGLLALFQGEFEGARRRFEESLILHENLSARRSIGMATTWLGIGLAVDGRYARGHAQGLLARAIAEEVSDPYAEGHARMLLGYTSLLLGYLDEAQHHLETGVTLFGQIGQQDELGQAYVYLTYVDLARGDSPGAQLRLVLALKQALATRTVLPILLALAGAAHLSIAREEPEKAIEVWSLAMTFPMIANSAMMDELGGRHVRVAASLLPQAAVSTAEERGRQRDLFATAEELLAYFDA